MSGHQCARAADHRLAVADTRINDNAAFHLSLETYSTLLLVLHFFVFRVFVMKNSPTGLQNASPSAILQL
jgi:hypothetical protein